jgi:hypothetical protein
MRVFFLVRSRQSRATRTKSPASNQKISKTSQQGSCTWITTSPFWTSSGRCRTLATTQSSSTTTKPSTQVNKPNFLLSHASPFETLRDCERANRCRPIPVKFIGLYRCADGRFLMSSRGVAVSNTKYLSSSETRVNAGIGGWKLYLFESILCQESVGGICFTNKWIAASQQPLTFSNHC